MAADAKKQWLASRVWLRDVLHGSLPFGTDPEDQGKAIPICKHGLNTYQAHLWVLGTGISKLGRDHGIYFKIYSYIYIYICFHLNM